MARRTRIGEKSDGRPRHEQIAADIRAGIMAGDLPPGTRLPSTPNLVAQFRAANATIQRALAVLKNEGFLDSHPGKGVYVRDRRRLMIEAAAYLAPAEGGFAYQLLDVAEIEPPTEVVQALGLAEGETALLRHRLLSHLGEPVEISWSYYPSALAKSSELAARKKIRGGAPRVLAELGCPQRDFVDRVSVRMPTTEEANMLELPANVPVIRQFRIVRTHGARPVEASILIKAGHLYELKYHQHDH